MEFIKLYEVNDRIMNAIDPETGEILIPEEEFDKLIEAGENGCNYFVALFKNAKATADALRAEKKARDEDFDVRIRACERTMERAQRALDNHLQGNMWQGDSGKVGYRKSTSTEATDMEAFLKWDGRHRFLRYEPKPIKDEIAKALDAGEQVVGWERDSHNNIQIK